AAENLAANGLALVNVVPRQRWVWACMDVEAAKPFRHGRRRPGRAGGRSSGLPRPHAGGQLGDADNRRATAKRRGQQHLGRRAWAAPSAPPPPRPVELPRPSDHATPDVLHGRKAPTPARATGVIAVFGLDAVVASGDIGGEPSRPSNHVVHALRSRGVRSSGLFPSRAGEARRVENASAAAVLRGRPEAVLVMGSSTEATGPLIIAATTPITSVGGRVMAATAVGQVAAVGRATTSVPPMAARRGESRAAVLPPK
ncbi:MAG: hypothetical protein QOG97_2945, partial [Acidimicrobiaceae bacterium]|nr:hypothetical protein [Acidimicrobiaceae bacterium]